MKLKTEWYCEKHRLLTEDLTREDFIIETVLKETLDDKLAILDDKDPRKKYIETIAYQISSVFNKEVKETYELAKTYNYPEEKRVDFVTRHKDNPFLYFAQYILPTAKGQDKVNMEEAKKVLIWFYLKNCYRLFEARKQLVKWGIKFEKVCIDSDN